MGDSRVEQGGKEGQHALSFHRNFGSAWGYQVLDEGTIVAPISGGILHIKYLDKAEGEDSYVDERRGPSEDFLHLGAYHDAYFPGEDLRTEDGAHTQPMEITAFDVAPKARRVALAVDSPVPRVYVFEFPSKRLVSIIQNFQLGNEKGVPDEEEPSLSPRTVATTTEHDTTISHISSVALSRLGDRCFVFGSSPGFLVSVWDLVQVNKASTPIVDEDHCLAASLFSSEVHKATCCPAASHVCACLSDSGIFFWHIVEKVNGSKLVCVSAEFKPQLDGLDQRARKNVLEKELAKRGILEDLQRKGVDVSELDPETGLVEPSQSASKSFEFVRQIGDGLLDPSADTGLLPTSAIETRTADNLQLLQSGDIDTENAPTPSPTFDFHEHNEVWIARRKFTDFTWVPDMRHILCSNAAGEFVVFDSQTGYSVCSQGGNFTRKVISKHIVANEDEYRWIKDEETLLQTLLQGSICTSVVISETQLAAGCADGRVRFLDPPDSLRQLKWESTAVKRIVGMAPTLPTRNCYGHVYYSAISSMSPSPEYGTLIVSVEDGATLSVLLDPQSVSAAESHAPASRPASSGSQKDLTSGGQNKLAKTVVNYEYAYAAAGYGVDGSVNEGATLEQLQVNTILDGHCGAAVLCARVNTECSDPDSRLPSSLVATAGMDATLRLWDCQEGKQLCKRMFVDSASSASANLYNLEGEQHDPILPTLYGEHSACSSETSRLSVLSSMASHPTMPLLAIGSGSGRLRLVFISPNKYKEMMASPNDTASEKHLRSLDFASEFEGIEVSQLSCSLGAPDLFATTVFSDWVHEGAITDIAFNDGSDVHIFATFSAQDGIVCVFRLNEWDPDHGVDMEHPLATPIAISKLPGYSVSAVPAELSTLASDVVRVASQPRRENPNHCPIVSMRFRPVHTGQMGSLKNPQQEAGEEGMAFDVSAPASSGGPRWNRLEPALDLELVRTDGTVISFPIPDFQSASSNFSQALEEAPDFSPLLMTAIARVSMGTPLTASVGTSRELLNCPAGAAPVVLRSENFPAFDQNDLREEPPLEFVRISEHTDTELRRTGPQHTLAAETLASYQLQEYVTDQLKDAEYTLLQSPLGSSTITALRVYEHADGTSLLLGDVFGNLHFMTDKSTTIAECDFRGSKYSRIQVGSRPITAVDITEDGRYVVVCTLGSNFVCLRLGNGLRLNSEGAVGSRSKGALSFASRVADFVGPVGSVGGVIGSIVAMKLSEGTEADSPEGKFGKGRRLSVEIGDETDNAGIAEEEEGNNEDLMEWAVGICTDGEIEVEQKSSRLCPLNARRLALVARKQQRDAERERESIRKQLEDLKVSLNDLLSSNARAPEMEQLNREEFSIDIAGERILENEAAERVDEVKTQATETIKDNQETRDQLVSKLWDNMEVHFATLHSFKGDVSISNFPLPIMSDEERMSLNKATYLRRLEQAAMRQHSQDSVTEEGVTEYGLLHSAVWSSLMEDFRHDTDWIFLAGLLPPSLNPSFQRSKLDSLKGMSSERKGSDSKTPTKSEQQGSEMSPASSTAKAESPSHSEDPYADFTEVLRESQALPSQENEEEAPEVGSAKTWAGGHVVKLLYHPAAVRTPNQKRMQILFLNALLRSVQHEYNQKFDKLWEAKGEEASRISNANSRIKEIQKELKSDTELFEPDLSLDYVPHSILEVSEEDVGFKPYVSEAELRRQKEEEERRRREAEANKDDAPERALHEMMYGTLEKKDALAALEKELDNEFEPWMDAVAEEQMSEEQKRKYYQYKSKLEEVEEQREARRQSLEDELRKLTNDVRESRANFDSKVAELRKSYLEFYESVIALQLYAVRLAENVHERDTNVDLEGRIVDQHMSFDNLKANAADAAESMQSRTNATREELNKLQNFDKHLEKSFRDSVREASTQSLDAEVMRVLTHLYKHRTHDAEVLDAKSRTVLPGSADAILKILHVPQQQPEEEEQAGQSLVDISSHSRGVVELAWYNPIENVYDNTDTLARAKKSLGVNIYKEDPFHKADIALAQRSRVGKIAEEEKQALAPVSSRDVPDDWEVGSTIEHSVWHKFQELREQKISSELQIARIHRLLSSMDIEMKHQLHTCSRQGVAVEKLTNLFSDTLTAREMLGCDLILLTRMKQGIDEVQSEEPIPDYGNAALVPRQAVEIDNARIKFLSSIKVNILEQHRDFRQELSYLHWELKYLRGKCQDMSEYYTDLQLLRVTKTLQDFIRGGDIGDKQRRDLMKIEARSRQLQQSHERHIQKIKRLLSSIKSQWQAKERENEHLLRRYKELKNAVQIRDGIVQSRTAGRTEETDPAKIKERKLQSVVRHRKLQDIVKYQKEDIEVLEEELQRIRERTFPSFTGMVETESKSPSHGRSSQMKSRGLTTTSRSTR
eukprot:gb/GECG01000123.1/.p1 GENE.gb/GECG01000123.1/~~gb/GECG01000123.1/.p1  ORF type:complete len:2383 (+),score=366.81 gb/GECG01000123.1/:1-7149(+)